MLTWRPARFEDLAAIATRESDVSVVAGVPRDAAALLDCLAVTACNADGVPVAAIGLVPTDDDPEAWLLAGYVAGNEALLVLGARRWIDYAAREFGVERMRARLETGRSGRLLRFLGFQHDADSGYYLRECR